MKEKEVKRSTQLDRTLQEQLVTGRRREGDRLMLADAVLLAALDGTRPLTANERNALEGSPLTARRLRQLVIERAAIRRPVAGSDWQGSAGMLRAADDGALARLVTDDGYWILHFSEEGAGWRIGLQLLACAPFTQRLLRERPVLCVLDAAGAVLLQARLDGDGECEGAWTASEPPARHFQRHGAGFTVRPAPED
jgi:hypothetical protein